MFLLQLNLSDLDICLQPVWSSGSVCYMKRVSFCDVIMFPYLRYHFSLYNDIIITLNDSQTHENQIQYVIT